MSYDDSAELAERDLLRQAADEPEREPEVRPEEFTAGIADVTGKSGFIHDVVEELKKPLDPNRVRRRQGRGNTSLEYLAGHDVKRRLNEIFGFGNWSTRVIEQVEIASVEVEKGDRQGWHVGYRATVRLTIKTLDGVAFYEDSGYGDGVEYGPAARVTACELALKEAVTDALKRSATYLGDQFGLILYAKGDEKARIARDSAAAGAREARSGTYVRDDSAGRVPRPKLWAEAISRFDDVTSAGTRETAGAWLEELVVKKHGVQSLGELTPGDRNAVFQGFSSVVMALEEQHGDLSLSNGQREIIRALFAERFDGVALEGPNVVLDSAERGQYPPAEGEGEGQGGAGEAAPEPEPEKKERSRKRQQAKPTETEEKS